MTTPIMLATYFIVFVYLVLRMANASRSINETTWQCSNIRDDVRRLVIRADRIDTEKACSIDIVDIVATDLQQLSFRSAALRCDTRELLQRSARFNSRLDARRHRVRR